MKKLEEKERFCKQAKEIHEKQELEGLVFKPTLVAKKKRVESAKTGGKREEELLDYGRKIQEKKERARVEIHKY